MNADGRALPTRLGRLLGVEVDRVVDLGGGHEWTLHRATLADGREVFVKDTLSGSGVFAAEAAGLRWLGEAGNGLALPVLAVDERTLLAGAGAAAPVAPAARPRRAVRLLLHVRRGQRRPRVAPPVTVRSVRPDREGDHRRGGHVASGKAVKT